MPFSAMDATDSKVTDFSVQDWTNAGTDDFSASVMMSANVRLCLGTSVDLMMINLLENHVLS